MRDLLEGAELVRYGARCVPAGGLYGQPKLYCDGALLVGDSASMLNIMKLSGVHQAMKSGMHAAETIIDAIANDDFTTSTLGGYSERYRSSWAYEEHFEGRNFTGSNEISTADSTPPGRAPRPHFPSMSGYANWRARWNTGGSNALSASIRLL